MIRFPVSDVAPATERRPDTDVSAVLHGHGILAAAAHWQPSAPLAQTLHGHGLLMAVHHAFSEHRPLRIAPDHIWLCIAQGMARWIDAHAERLRGRLVRHPGRLPLEVRRDDFVDGGDNDWPGAIAAICGQMREHLGGRADLFVADFSTTDEVARAASHVALMAGMQRYFAYTAGTLCGIPEITLEGSAEDWIAIRRRVDLIGEGELDLEDWAAKLGPVCDKLIETARGDIDADWWRDLYKLHTASGGDVVTGWINVMFPFIKDEGIERNPAVFEPDYDAEFSFEPKLRDFPTGLSQAPFTWNYHGDRRPMALAGGFFGVAQLPDTSLRPELGWAVIAEPGARRFMIHGAPEWTPNVSPRDPKGLRSLEGIAGEVAGLAAYALRLSFCGELESLAGIERLDRLVELTLTDNAHVTSLDALANLPNLRKLHIAQCANLRDISALRTLSALESLCLQRCPTEDVATLAALEHLTSLSLFIDAVPKPLCKLYRDRDEVRAAQEELRRLG